MFERSHDYDAFYVNKEHALADEVRDGALWLRDWPNSDEGLLVTPVKAQLEYSSVASVFRGLKAGKAVNLGRRLMRTATWRTYPGSWRGGPVLALWPDHVFLGKLHDDYRVKALCVVPGSIDEVQAWITATQAVDLRSGKPAAALPPLDPVVEQAMISLTRGLNHNNRLLGSADKADAISTLLALHRSRFKVDPAALEMWALGHDWPADEAARFREFAENINRGHHYQVRNMLRDDIVDYWKQTAAEADN